MKRMYLLLCVLCGMAAVVLAADQLTKPTVILPSTQNSVKSPIAAGDGPKLPGIWKLVAYEIEIQATGQREHVMGKNPTGYVNFTPEGRAFFVLTGEGRKPAKTMQDRAGSDDHACRVHRDVSHRRRSVDYKNRRGLGPSVGRDRTAPKFQDRR